MTIDINKSSELPHIHNLSGTAKLCKENGINISARFIKELCVKGEIVSFRVGNKILVNWDSLMVTVK
jgi:hypothetical protein